jgi:adhesin transport system membrane fusion protein
MTEASTRRRRIPILWLMIAALGVLAGFAALFEIDHSVRATGQVIPGLRTQIIQAVDGGAHGDPCPRGRPRNPRAAPC